MSAKSTTAMTATHSYPPGEARRVLLVDDEARLREMWTTAIRDMGFQPTAAPSAEAALRLIDKGESAAAAASSSSGFVAPSGSFAGDHAPFDVAILDLNLPGMGGMELLEVLHRRWPMMQAIILTGFGDLESAKRAIRLDVADFLTKPCSLDQLEVALDRARNRRLQAAAAAEGGPPLPEIPPEARFNPEPDRPAPALSLEELEQKHILAVLEKNRGNRTATAGELGISLRKLYYRLEEYQKKGLLPPER